MNARMPLFALLLLLCLAAPIFAASDTLIVPGERVGWMTVGMDYGAVTKAFAGANCRKDRSGDLDAYHYEKFKFTFLVNQANQVVIIVTSNPRYHLPDGLAVGASRAAVTKAFGAGRDDGEYVFYYDKGVGFRIVNNAVVEIGVLAPAAGGGQNPG